MVDSSSPLCNDRQGPSTYYVQNARLERTFLTWAEIFFGLPLLYPSCPLLLWSTEDRDFYDNSKKLCKLLHGLPQTPFQFGTPYHSNTGFLPKQKWSRMSKASEWVTGELCLNDFPCDHSSPGISPCQQEERTHFTGREGIVQSNEFCITWSTIHSWVWFS